MFPTRGYPAMSSTTTSAFRNLVATPTDPNIHTHTHTTDTKPPSEHYNDLASVDLLYDIFCSLQIALLCDSSLIQSVKCTSQLHMVGLLTLYIIIIIHIFDSCHVSFNFLTFSYLKSMRVYSRIFYNCMNRCV